MTQKNLFVMNMIQPLLKPVTRHKHKARDHKKACHDFLQYFYNEHGNLFCQICGRVNQLYYDACHIYSSGQWGWYLEIHNFLNIFCGCRECHTKFDHHELPEVLERFEEERGLKQLFNSDEKS